MRRHTIAGMLLLLCLPAAGCGGGGSDEPSDASLRNRLLPAAEVKAYEFRRAYIWTDPLDATIQGLQLSENTKPSDVVNAIKDAGFVKGAGEEYQQGSIHGPIIGITATKYDSDAGAEKARDVVHTEYRKQPCYGICSQKESDLTVDGIPDAEGVASEPDPAAPVEAQPGFEAYAIAFTIGPYLYVVQGGGNPGVGMKESVTDAAQKLYARVKDL
jgi:hypothetical protein